LIKAFLMIIKKRKRKEKYAGVITPQARIRVSET
jgi:hypothetical protein